MSEEKNQGNAASLNLSDLADFQFGPAWARPGAASSPVYTERPAREPRAPRRREGGERRPFNRDRRRDGGIQLQLHTVQMPVREVEAIAPELYHATGRGLVGGAPITVAANSIKAEVPFWRT